MLVHINKIKSDPKIYHLVQIEEAAEKEKQKLNIHHLVHLQEQVVEKEKNWIPCSSFTIHGSKDFAFRTSQNATSAFRENDFVIAYIRWTQVLLIIAYLVLVNITLLSYYVCIVF